MLQMVHNPATKKQDEMLTIICLFADQDQSFIDSIDL